MRIQINVDIGHPNITPAQAEYLAGQICFFAEATIERTKFENEFEVTMEIINDSSGTKGEQS